VLDRAQLVARAAEAWQADVLPLLLEFGTIPDLSPAYDPHWQTAGHLERAAELLARWATSRDLPGATVEVVRLPGLTPTVLVDVPASDDGAVGDVLVYGHYDKQPPFDGWSEGRGPWTPVMEDDRLYGRGLADDGYALPSALIALQSVRAAGGRHGRCVILAEGSEESGSPHLRQVLAHLGDRIGTPDLVVALDGSAATYDRLWLTTSLRGGIAGNLTVRVLEHGVHSGSAGAIVPSSFRIARLLLDRIEDPATGDLRLPELRSEMPDGVGPAAQAMAEAVHQNFGEAPPFPVVAGLRLEADDPAERSLRAAWRGSLAVVGADGLPPSETAGAVFLPFTTLRLVVRIPPTADADAAERALRGALTEDPPYGATVEWTTAMSAGGWAARPFPAWLNDALDEASNVAFGRPSGQMGEGGSIPFLGWLAAQFPAAHLLALGVLGPGSNAHGPDESLHVPSAQRLTAAVGSLLDAHARRQ
jgi:acetylornithine deacetylase/succinyl-diaminopimelate desuccinylase-like protein